MSLLIKIFSNTTFWIALSSILQGLAAIVAFSALRYSITTFTKSLNLSNYTELDRMYFDLLKTAIEKPHLIDPEATRSKEQQMEYDAYAFMVWNVLESVYDRCHANAELRETWYPVVDMEERRHGKWFYESGNQNKFKTRFRDFIVDRFKNRKQHGRHPQA